MPASTPSGLAFKKRKVDIDKIVRKDEFQPRVEGESYDHIADLREVIKAGGKLTPLPRIVIVQGMGPVLVRGFHQIAAHEAEGATWVWAECAAGTHDQAKAEAACSNSSPEHVKGPLRMSRASKRRAARMLVEVYPNLSAKELAKRLGGIVSDETILDIKRELKIEAGEKLDDRPERKGKKAARDKARRTARQEAAKVGGAEDAVITFDWGMMRQAIGALAKYVQGVVRAHPKEQGSPSHTKARELLDQLDLLLFGDGGWQASLSPKKGAKS